MTDVRTTRDMDLLPKALISYLNDESRFRNMIIAGYGEIEKLAVVKHLRQKVKWERPKDKYRDMIKSAMDQTAKDTIDKVKQCFYNLEEFEVGEQCFVYAEQDIQKLKIDAFQKQKQETTKSLKQQQQLQKTEEEMMKPTQQQQQQDVYAERYESCKEYFDSLFKQCWMNNLMPITRQRYEEAIQFLDYKYFKDSTKQNSLSGYEQPLPDQIDINPDKATLNLKSETQNSPILNSQISYYI